MRTQLTSGLCFCLLLAIAAHAAATEEFEPVDLPPELAQRLEGIPEEKLDFLRGEDALNFAERHDILFARFRNKSAAEIEGYIDAMMRVRELMKFDPDRDLASIPLNTESDDFNWFRTRRPPEFDTPREPGGAAAGPPARGSPRLPRPLQPGGHQAVLTAWSGRCHRRCR